MSALALNLFDSKQQTTCCECGVAFASPVIIERRRDGEWFYCPSGHQQHYIQTEAQRLRKEVEQLKRDLEWQRGSAQTARQERDHAWRSAAAHKAHSARARKKLARVHAGVCPECHRSFPQLARHIKSKHPGLAPQRRK